MIKGEPIRPLVERLTDPEPATEPRDVDVAQVAEVPETQSLPDSLPPSP